MRTGKDVDWSHVVSASFDIKEYYNDIAMFKIVSHYVKLDRDKDINTLYKGIFIKDNVQHNVKVNIEYNICCVDDEVYDPEAFISLMDYDVDTLSVIKELTGIEHDDYCTDVEYSNGTIELLEVKGRCLLSSSLLRNNKN